MVGLIIIAKTDIHLHDPGRVNEIVTKLENSQKPTYSKQYVQQLMDMMVSADKAYEEIDAKLDKVLNNMTALLIIPVVLQVLVIAQSKK